MASITPFLWFDADAEEAAKLYTSIFPRSEITKVVKKPAGVPGPAGVILVSFVVNFSLSPFVVFRARESARSDEREGV